MELPNLMNSKNIFLFIILSLCILQVESQTVHGITEDVSGYSEYKKAEFSKESSNLYYFKYDISTMPQSKVMAFRFQFDKFDSSFRESKILCTSVASSTSDDQLKKTLDGLSQSTSSCIGDFSESTEEGIYDGIIKLDTSKTKIGIKLQLEGVISFTARIFLRIQEEILQPMEQKKGVDQKNSLVPCTLVISSFREKASKILFYSYTRELQMYYIEGDVPYPEVLFSGNVLSVYTNPHQVKQKYKNANTMILLTRPFAKVEPVSELFNFQIKLFDSNYLLDYFVSNEPYGRSKNKPLMINMTECTDPYYVVLNYNQKEKKTSLFIDQIYGKIKTLSVAYEFSQIEWDSMLETDLKEIRATDRYFQLPAEIESHIDVYKVECELPLLLNFYYVSEQSTIPDLDYGHVAIVSLAKYKTYSLPFAQDVVAPILTIEVFNPIKLPSVIINDGINENLISKNSLIRSTPITTLNPLVIKERGGDAGTRVIIKVGYRISGSDWSHTGNIYYNSAQNLYVYNFPNGQDKYNYTFADLITKGTTEGDNIKYCFATSIGSPILPSAENCYRVSLDNSYTLKVLNPLIIYKDYDFQDDVGYFVSIKPVVTTEKMSLTEFLHKYDTTERNIEGESNVVTITDGTDKSILTAPVNKDEKEFVQITQCSKNDITIQLKDAFYQKEIVIEETKIASGTKNYFQIVNNILLETELIIKGTTGDKVFIRHSGIRSGYNLKLIENPTVTFDQSTNQFILQHPIESYERIEYTVYIGKENEISSKGITLCSIHEGALKSLYSKTVIAYAETASVAINFDKAGFKSGQKFEAIIYYEQKLLTKMAFLSDVIKQTVGEIKIDAITEINKSYSEDADYVYAQGTATSDGKSLYFSYMPEDIRDVPVGAFRIEMNSQLEKSLGGVSCAFVNKDETASGMIEAVEDIISVANPYCIGGKSTTNSKYYNYIFRYSYTNDNQPRRLIIKISNNQEIADGFTVYLRKGNNTYIEPTDFAEQKEYGNKEEYLKTMMPYIIDLKAIRGSKDNYISKLLLYSRYLEMQMYYLDETNEYNMPLLLFTGGIMLIYTKPALALQKYHSTKLILLTENLNGQEHTILGNNFRFHTKMFKSTDQIEFFLSNNPTGRTLNYPLSLEINTCTSKNNKYYYILNYNRAEDERILYLDLLYGVMSKARVVTSINSNHWDELIRDDMKEITEMQMTLSKISQHIDVIEIQCQTPLLANAYYNTPDEQYLDLKKGNIAIKNIPSQDNIKITLDPYLSGILYTSISAYNANGDSDLTVNYDSGNSIDVQGNSLKISMLYSIPKSVSIVNNGKSASRIIFKIGYGVEGETDWIEEKTNYKGALYSNENKFVYKFPYGFDKRNFTTVDVIVKPLKKDTEPESPNIKFCYSTSMGMAIDTSKENCFRTGANIHYTLTFINPLIVRKNYNSVDLNYYVTFSPFDYSKYISLEIYENKYEIEKRGVEGVPTILNFEEGYEKGIILSMPADSTNNKIFVQLQACAVSENDNITYTNLNAYSKETISSGKLKKSSRLTTYTLDNNKMETEIDFKGFANDKVFVKHMGVNNVDVSVGDYSAIWIESYNTVSITKPIKDKEAFRITVLVAPKGHFDDYSLCTFFETPYDKYSTLGDYVATFTSVESDIVTHYIEFNSIPGYEVGKEFDLLVYAVQVNKMKVEVLYNVISGKVGKIDGLDGITGKIPKKEDYVTQLFIKNTTKSSNYLFYNFNNKPTGNIASLKIFAEKNEGMLVSKVICTFVESNASPETMIKAVNEAERTFNNLCTGESFKDSNGYDALINTKNIDNGKTKLVLLVKYGMGNDKNKIKDINEDIVMMNITIRTTGLKVDKEEYEYNEDEGLTYVPYVFDLKEIREMQKENYHSKVLIYSSTREMDMFYIQDGAPVELFSGNIMMVYTNEEVIKEKYNGASTMILLTDSLKNKKQPPFGEKFKFKVYFFDSSKTMQYFVSANPNGRPLNNPTSIEILDCDQPYTYILNYHHTEGNRMLHIDTIFGEINTTKFADQLNALSWDTFIQGMSEFKGDELVIKGQTKYHIDVFQVTCKTPLLLNVYYTDETNPTKSNLQQGDMTILTLHPNTKDSLSFVDKVYGGVLLYSFSVHRKYGEPNIYVQFEDKTEDDFPVDKNGIYIVKVFTNKTDPYRLITIYNKQLTGDDTTKVYFKFAYNIDENFTKIQNDMYNIQTKDRRDNIFAYIFKNGEDRLNYTKVDFKVTTESDNVKFCYSTNIGAFINPSTQNCFRVGAKNPYTISVMNPYIMSKNNYIKKNENDYHNYYVSFKTTDKDLNITIIPNITMYDTLNRNLVDEPKTLKINKEGKTILTNPVNKEYVFIQMAVCSANSPARYEIKNAFNGKVLKENGQIQSNSKFIYENILNINLDTELVIKTNYKDVDMFVKHTGLGEEFNRDVKPISIKYEDKKIIFNQPIVNEQFKYTILIDKKDNIKNQQYTLCSFAKKGRFAPLTIELTSAEREIKVDFDFEKDKELEDFKEFDALVLAEETGYGKMMILSDIFTSDKDKSDDSSAKQTRTALIVVIIVLSVICILGGVAVFLYLRKLKSQPRRAIIAKPTDFSDIEGTDQEKLVESMSKSVSMETP